MERRDFIKFCAASAAAIGAPAVDADATRAALLARAAGRRERRSRCAPRTIPVNRNLIFHYPFAATPCFLLNLGKAGEAGAAQDRRPARPTNGRAASAPSRSIVAYSAICAHQLPIPTKDISFISYRTEKSARNRIGNVIHCCAEHSQYDPAEGARVVAGPAPQPLAAILLEHDAATDEINAVGTLGGEMFNEFFAKYGFELQLEHGGAARAPVAGTTASCRSWRTTAGNR